MNPTTSMKHNDTPSFVFLGTPRFAAIVLDELARRNRTPVAVITAHDKPMGRKKVITPSPVAEWALAHGIPIKYADTKKEAEKALESAPADIALTAAFNVILTEKALKIPRHGILNIHPSILPAYRGPSPIQGAILDGVRETGCSLFVLDNEIDHGPVIAHNRLAITNSHYLALEEKFARLGTTLFTDSLDAYVSGTALPLPQNHSKATFTKKFTVEDGKLDLENESADTLLARVRALNPEPGTYAIMRTRNGERRVKILDGEIKSGEFVPTSVVPDGKREMSWDDFRRGNL